MKITSITPSEYVWWDLVILEDNSSFLLSHNTLSTIGKLQVGEDIDVELAKVGTYSNVKIPFAKKVTRKGKEVMIE